jgi:hypothetical protein
MQSLLVKLNLTPALPFITLRNIADYMGAMNKQDAIDFLKECGVSFWDIKRKKETSEIFYEVLKKFAISNKALDREKLAYVIKKSISPALYKNSNITSEQILAEYNRWLKDSELKIIFFRDELHFIRSYPLESRDIESQKNLEEGFALKVKKNTLVLERIAEIRYAYKVLINITKQLPSIRR